MLKHLQYPNVTDMIIDILHFTKLALKTLPLDSQSADDSVMTKGLLYFCASVLKINLNKKVDQANTKVNHSD